MALAIDIMHEHGPSNEMCLQRRPRLAINFAVKVFYVLYITKIMEHSSCHRYNACVWLE